MAFREVWLTPGAAVNCRFRTGKHQNPPENLLYRPPRHCLKPGKEPLAATFRASGTSHPMTSDGLS